MRLLHINFLVGWIGGEIDQVSKVIQCSCTTFWSLGKRKTFRKSLQVECNSNGDDQVFVVAAQVDFIVCLLVAVFELNLTGV